MESENNNIIPSELPQPVPNQEQVHEKVVTTPETKPSVNTAAPILPVVNQSQSQPINPTQSTAPVAAAPLSNSQTDDLIADDADLIEKEWVDKAKAIVAQTKDDPHLQNQEITKVKTDYLKKRYNKDIKLVDK
ncbi:MAG TPA: hypothetical protein VLF79_04335 [Candidatus Saccharimonadales bacterium]|nr:hypothetical protein [Candidatus Saccharimonadales bacterium]